MAQLIRRWLPRILAIGAVGVLIGAAAIAIVVKTHRRPQAGWQDFAIGPSAGRNTRVGLR